MKKLLIAMSAAAMFSLCAKAESTTLLGGMNFETGYSAGDPIATTSTDPGSASPLLLWAGDNGESQIAVEGENKYLKVDTTAELTRKTAVPNAATNPVSPVDIGDGDITVSAKVQFTAADEAPEAGDGDKLIVWAKAPDENDPQGPTNLMVTAKAVVGNTTIVTNFVTDTHVDAEAWYDLEIKAVATGSVDEGDPSVAFTVSIARSESGLTPAAVTVDGQPATFKSLLATSDPAAQTIASIGFKGTGAVDNIVFAKNEAVPPVPVELSCTVNGGADSEGLVTIQDANGDTVDTANVGDTLTIIVAAQQTDSVTCAGLTFNWVSDDQNEAFIATYTLTAEDGEAGSKAFAITVTAGGASAIVPDMRGVPATVTFSPEFAASYAAGDKIDPTKITASTSKAGYTVSFEISVNGTPIVAETTLAAGDTVTVTATETAIEYTITYTYADANSNPLTDVENTNTNKFTVEDAVTIDSAKISKEGYTVTSVTPATIAQGTTGDQTVAVVLTAVPTYTVTAAAVEGATVTFSTNTAVVSGTTVTFTIAVTDETKEIDTVKNGETELTANEGVYSVTVADANIVITVTLKNKTTPGTYPTYIENTSAETKAKYAAWASKYGDDTLSANEDAYLLNCEPTAEAVAAAKAAFKFTSITPGQIPTISGENYNGVVVILGGTSLSDIAKWDKATTSDTFFKAILVVEESQN